jgi:hypothetical protein
MSTATSRPGTSSSGITASRWIDTPSPLLRDVSNGWPYRTSDIRSEKSRQHRLWHVGSDFFSHDAHQFISARLDPVYLNRMPRRSPTVRGMAEGSATLDLAHARAWDAPARRTPAEDRATPATHTAPLQKEPGDRISAYLRLTEVMSACPRTRREPLHQPACAQVS